MLSNDEIQRYARHLSLDQVGIDGQEKLKNAKVLVVGAGGLGCPVLQYLTAAGVGTIGVVDGDKVDVSNLQRQVLFDMDDVGEYKSAVAVRKLKRQNPFIHIHAIHQFLHVDNAMEIIKSYDIIIDGSDNFPTRYLVGDATMILQKPLVFGSIFKFEGQVSVFNYQHGPSYRCVFPDPPTAGSVPNCEEVGVIGVLPGIIGAKMAVECIKMILGIGEVLSGKLEVVDILGNHTMLLHVQRKEENFIRTELETDYEEACGITKKKAMQLTGTQLKQELDNGKKYDLVDVREDFEFEICTIPGSKHIPLGELSTRFNEISKDIPTVMICHHGMRSAQAIGYLGTKGYTNLINLSGGVHAWANEVDETMVKY